MSDEQTKRYLIHIRYAADMATVERIRESTPAIKAILENASDNNCKLAWTSSDGASFGFLLRTKYAAKWLFTELMSPGQHSSSYTTLKDPMPGKTSPMRSGDSIMILELGTDFYANGFSNSWAWLQRH